MHTAATLFQGLCYENKDALSAGIIVAGWDKEVGPSVYNIPLGGGLFRQPWAIGGKWPLQSVKYEATHRIPVAAGSGSTYVYGYCDATYQEGWNEAETVNFVKNSTCSLCTNFALLINLAQPSHSRCPETVPQAV